MARPDQLVRLLDRERFGRAAGQGCRLLVGVSGGADSVALLCALAEVAPEYGLELGAVHVNHGLRVEASSEEHFVVELCGELRIPCHVRRLDVNVTGPAGGSAEGHWRALRYAEFAAIMRDYEFDALALGHNADDLAETFLFHLARGTGVDGLTFQFTSEKHGMQIIRPFWKTSRADIEAALRGLEQSWMEDPSNHNTHHRRNLIRHKIMPLMREINPDATGAIVRASEAIGDTVEVQSCHCLYTEAGIVSGTLPLRGITKKDADRPAVGAAVREFVRENSANITSGQLEQARQIILADKTGLVSLADSKTLVITRQFAWIISQPEPTTLALATEHCRRFGGFVAAIESEIALDQDTCITGLDGAAYRVCQAGGPAGVFLANRREGAVVGNTPLKKILNQHQVPWYMREWQVYVFDKTSNNVLALVTAEDCDLARAIRRHSRVNLRLEITQGSNRA